LEIEFGLQQIPAVPKGPIPIYYKGRLLRKAFEPDFICFEQVILEIKAVSALTDEHRAQVINYLQATGLEVGLLVNFGHHPQLQYERLIHQRQKLIPATRL
jgi:GxxExxY protein